MIEIKKYNDVFLTKDEFFSLMQEVNLCFTPPYQILSI